MLDTETKRRIDTARDILVGVVPDPKSQVEQITIALIYKFMDDMDAEAEELGGARKFFTGEFAQYGWAKLMSPATGGYAMLNLYSEAITRMTGNQGIPSLFRDMFKNAYLPYRNPETLRSFLKVINDFEYDHSERLGDAFEYLLSVLGAQGDAGQFRTPRHIIDFMVAVIDPKKEESILDPACGTAGFLISAWKHILQANSKEGRKGAGLTPDERKRLTENIKGYDISPDMVRLSLVNLYLHGFTVPHISEYDTLTSEDNWNEYGDIILANPPFMSPRGGIKPHKRFSIQAKRSEVLFVDYIAEHLTPNGRAAVIVPEGIIFQSQNAYKQLRKMLVENTLYAVVSLPAGVFNPYSGVKTSILLMDKTLAKKSDSILFVKVENNGFGLGAQRRKIEKNDLPEALKTIQEFVYMDAQDGQDKKEKFCLSMSNALIVKKEKIAENGEWNLSGERYRESDGIQHSNYEMVKIGDACEIKSGGTPSKKNGSYWNNGSVKWISSKHINNYGKITGHELISEKAVNKSSTKIAPKNSTIIITRVSVGKLAFADDDYAINQDLTAIVSKDEQILYPKFITVVALRIARVVEKNAEGIGVRGVTRKFLSELQIPLPPLKIQQEIVAEIEGYQKIIDGARAVVDNYKPQIQINPDWEMVELGDKDVFTIESGGTPSSKIEEYWNGDINWATLVDLPQSNSITKLYNTKRKITETGLKKSSAKLLPKNTILVSSRATIGRIAIVKKQTATNQGFKNIIIKDEQKALPYFVAMCMTSKIDELKAMANGGTFREVSKSKIKQIKIPLPPLETQTKIVAQIEKEQSLVNANKELITLFEQKIKDKIASVWGEEQ